MQIDNRFKYCLLQGEALSMCRECKGSVNIVPPYGYTVKEILKQYSLTEGVDAIISRSQVLCVSGSWVGDCEAVLKTRDQLSS